MHQLILGGAKSGKSQAGDAGMAERIAHHQRDRALRLPALACVALRAATGRLVAALQAAPGLVLLVSDEIGLGVLAMSPEARRFVDAPGLLRQAVAACCGRVVLMVAGQPLWLNGAPA